MPGDKTALSFLLCILCCISSTYIGVKVSGSHEKHLVFKSQNKRHQPESGTEVIDEDDRQSSAVKEAPTFDNEADNIDCVNGPEDTDCVKNCPVACLTDCQTEDLNLCPKKFYPHLNLYLRPLSCPLPHCSSDGSYYTERCEGSACHCVNKQTGLEIPGTEHTHGQQRCDEEGDIIPDSRTFCEKQRSLHCEPQRIEGSSTEVVLPDCPALLCSDAGSFNPRQCADDICFCVNVSTGIEFSETRSTDMGIFDCDDAGQVVNTSRGNEGRCGKQDILVCDEHEEWFLRDQCTADYCFCVYIDSGRVITDSAQVDETPVCPTLIDTRTVCQKERDESCQVVFKMGQLVPRACVNICDGEGYYPTERCEEQTCHCVDRVTGARSPDTQFTKGSYYCSAAAELVYIPHCLRQSALSCTESGAFQNTQCLGELCWCVYSDSGEQVFESNTAKECSKINDTRGSCTKSRDAVCHGSDNCHTLSCTEAGHFAALQCLKGDVCFCVDASTGEMLSSAQNVASDVSCSDAGIKQVNCSGEQCLSRTHCQRHGGALCDSEGQYGPSCSAKEDNSKVHCTTKRFYQPRQCTGSVCYCVDIVSGYVFANTVRQADNFYCTTLGDVIGRTACQNQSLYTCDSLGNFLPKQEIHGRFECVYIDSGLLNYHDQKCLSSFDLRKKCEKDRDDMCPYLLDGTGYIPDLSCESVQCDMETGAFLPKQCRADSCYCVNEATGATRDRPLSPDSDFTCTSEGNLILLTPCRKQQRLKCAADGAFAPDQFQDNVYFCVFADSGEILEESKSLVKPRGCYNVSDKRTRCQRARDEMCPVMLSGIQFTRPATCSALKCDVTSGLYNTTQCGSDGSCFCVHPVTGSVTSEPMGSSHTFTCNSEGEFVELTVCQQQDSLKCRKDGQFQSKQCFTPTACYCVYNDSGALVHNSHLSGEECLETPDTRTHCQMNLDTRCPAIYNAETGLFGISDRCDAMRCNEAGSYVSQHCFGVDSCYCIGSKSGTVLEGTLGSKDTFICSEDGEKLKLTLCRRQSVFSCDQLGYFNFLQCGNDGTCSCVYIDTGHVIKGVQSESCYSRVDNRTICQKKADSECENESDCTPPVCDEQGKFERTQCSGSQCFCVEPDYGIPVDNTPTFREDSHWCDENGKPRDMTICKAQHLLVCDNEGRFQPTQCNAQFCFCVYLDSGDVMEDTESIFYPGEGDCPALQENRTSCQIRAYKSCPKYIRPGTNTIGRKEGCQPFRCREDDRYFPKLCQDGTCWCNDVNEGSEIPGSRGAQHSFYCTDLGQQAQRGITIYAINMVDGCYDYGLSAYSFRLFPPHLLATPPDTCAKRHNYRSAMDRCECKRADPCSDPGCKFIGGSKEMEQHYKRKHLKVYKRMCKDCYQSFSNMANLKRHQKVRCNKIRLEYTFGLVEKVQYTACERKRYGICGEDYDAVTDNWIRSEFCLEYQCEEEDRLFVAKQCLGPLLCWCVDRRTGDIIENSVSSNCSLECHSNNTYTLSPCQETTPCLQQEVQECDYTGDFHPRQEGGGLALCVYLDSGRFMPFSEGASQLCPRVKDNRGNCQIDYYETCKGIYDHKTMKFEYGENCFRPHCSSDERYASRQCEGDICWCVDDDTGTRLPGTTGISYQVECEPHRSGRCTHQYHLRCEGNYYKETQCTNRFCYCVYVDTGKLIWGSMTREIANCTRQYDTRGHCRRAKEEACRAYYFDYTGTFLTLPDCEFTKECDRDGNFQKMQCVGDTCTCTDPRSGNPLRDTAGPKGTFTCNEKGEKITIILRDRTKCETEGIEQCTSEGWYPTPDCSHGVCYCVYADSGAPIYGTEVSGSFPHCDQKFDDRSICRKHNEEVCSNRYEDGQIITPTICPGLLECWDNGLFAPNQCRPDGMCFCVTVTTGESIEGTFAERGKLACDEFGNVEVLPTTPPTACQAQETLQCDSFGNFIPRQCSNPVCVCVYVDSGRVVAESYSTIQQANAQECADSYDKRTQCEVERDEACKPTFNVQTFEFETPTECYSVRCKSDGSFKSMQCLGRYTCNCVDAETGAAVSESVLPVGELLCGQEHCDGIQCVCHDERGRPMSRLTKPPCFTHVGPLTCPEKRKQLNRLGSLYGVQCSEIEPEKYKIKQCFKDEECWCVDPFNGTRIHGSMGTPEQVSCRYDPPCVRQQKAEIASAVSYEGFYPVSLYAITQCEPDGEFYPKQCDVTVKECWCVDETGLEIKGTRALPWISDVRCVRISPPNFSQRKPRVTVKCPSDLPAVFCPRNNCKRARCTATPTAECVQYRCRTCDALYYDPETFHPVTCLYHKLSCFYDGNYYQHGEEFTMGCSLTCYCYQGALRCRARCLLRNKPSCTDPVVIQDPLDSCCKIYACRDKSFMNDSIPLFDDLKSRRRKKRDLDITQLRIG